MFGTVKAFNAKTLKIQNKFDACVVLCSGFASKYMMKAVQITENKIVVSV